ncbi:TetR/AcrR family transcriptional regulator [Vibrio maerlii]|uniref:TetR/AcrR family transcriptional regulator n=1 Tax=Vibrio maerlii TaxID=2231648 RepID=UPI001F12C319|nr:TetR/AcrR family transcriptional regulator [Vibrio maerlii]
MVLSPRSAKKREQILQAAGQLFTQHGYATSMDNIAELAQVSKQTVYAHFKTKDELFETCVMDKCETTKAKVGLLEDTREIESVLFDFALGFQNMLLTDEALNIHRTAVSQLESHPDLAKAYLKAGPERTTQMLLDYLQHQQKQGILVAELSMEHAAVQFMLMIHGKAVYWHHLGTDIKQSVEEQRAYLKSSVELFLNGYKA